MGELAGSTISLFGSAPVDRPAQPQLALADERPVLVLLRTDGERVGRTRSHVSCNMLAASECSRADRTWEE